MTGPLVLISILAGLAIGLSAGGRRSGPPGVPPRVIAAAAKLGVDPRLLSRTLAETGRTDAEFASAAARLGVSEPALRAALTPPRRV